jgi:hypothetical protein
MSTLNLLGFTTRVETPFIKVTIGDYTFGVFDKQDLKQGVDEFGIFKLQKIKYPNFIQSLDIVKINGKVNRYTLNISYQITQDNDPNFFEKVFSSVSTTRRIIFSYGDVSAPSYIYRDEQAIITDIRSQFNVSGSKIDYTISAVSSALLGFSGSWTFAARRNTKPSDVIFELLYEEKYGMLEVFPGMRNRGLVLLRKLIPGDDVAVNLDRKPNMSVLDYLTYLVNSMASNRGGIPKEVLYSIVIVDDTTGDFEGPYFKIVPVERFKDDLQTYEIDIGYPSQNLVVEFNVENNQTYSLFYNYQKSINDAEYKQRISDTGELEEVYAPVLSSKTENFDTSESDKTWWTKVTEFPITASITLKGLLRPAILMTKVRLNVYYFGRKHISSGLYIITAQEDRIDRSGYRTTLKMVRVSSDNSEFIE